MKENMILKKIQAGEQVVGTFFETIGTSIVECLGIVGLDFFIVDFEHRRLLRNHCLKLFIQLNYVICLL